ncbi:MAG: AlpA family phage regulatory protein, partial [Rhodospirillales bacterium]
MERVTMEVQERFIRLPEVLNVTGLSRASVYRLE